MEPWSRGGRLRRGSQAQILGAKQLLPEPRLIRGTCPLIHADQRVLVPTHAALLKDLAHPTRFERVAFAFGGQRSKDTETKARIRDHSQRTLASMVARVRNLNL